MSFFLLNGMKQVGESIALQSSEEIEVVGNESETEVVQSNSYLVEMIRLTHKVSIA